MLQVSIKCNIEMCVEYMHLMKIIQNVRILLGPLKNRIRLKTV